MTQLKEGAADRRTALVNGALWTDTSGQPIHAHGGGMLQDGGYTYWFGEDRRGHRRVSCYRSANLIDWEFRGDALTLHSPFRPLETRTDPRLITDPDTGRGANIERPKVVRNPRTGQYVMWMHWENGKDYADARCAVATCDTVDGEYVYRGSFNPVGHMSRDCTLFVDDDGTAYFISAARDNADLHIYRLSEDYLAIDEHVKTLWPGQYREAPAMMKRGGIYFLVTSGCTGWLPNQGKYAFADSITGRWSPLYDLGGPTTFDTQPTYILPVHGKEATSWLYIGDRWDPTDYHRSSYAALPLTFPDERTMRLAWADSVAPHEAAGIMAAAAEEGSGRCRIRTASHRYLASQAAAAGPEPQRSRSPQAAAAGPEPQRSRSPQAAAAGPEPQRSPSPEAALAEPEPQHGRTSQAAAAGPEPQHSRSPQVAAAGPEPQRSRSPQAAAVGPEPQRSRSPEAALAEPEPQRSRSPQAVAAGAASPPQGAAVVAAALSYAASGQLWTLEPAEGDYVFIRHADSGGYLTLLEAGEAAISPVALAMRRDGERQQWLLVPAGDGARHTIRSRAGGLALTLNREHDGLLHAAALRDDRDGRQAQTFLIAEHYGVQ